MGHLATIGTKTQNAAASSVAITLTAGAAVGSTVLVGIIWEAGGGTGVPTISAVADSRSNTYSTTPDVTAGGATNSTVAGAVLRTRVTTALQVGDTITVTISGGTRSRWAMQADAFDDINASTPLDKTATTGNTAPSGTALATGSTATTTQANELVYAIYGFGSGRTVTIPAGWSGGAKVETSAGSSDRALQVAWQYVNSTGAQQGTLTLSSSSTYTAAAATYKYTPAGPLTVRISQVSLEVPNPGDAAFVRISQVAFEVPAAAVGTVRIAQVSLEVPAAPGQRPPTGIKVLSGGVLREAGLSVAVHGEI